MSYFHWRHVMCAGRAGIVVCARRPSIVWAIMVLCSMLGLGCRAKPIAQEPPPKKLRIGYLPITDHLTILAKARSTYRKADFEPIRFGAWPELSEALKAGKIEGAFVLSPIALGLRAKGVPLKAVLLGHRNGSVVTVAKDGRIHSPAELVGKTVAIPNRFSTHNILLHMLLEKSGIDAKDVKVVELPPPEMVNALATRRIDGFIVAEPFGAQAEAQNVGRVLTLSKDIWEDHICCVLTLLESALSGAPEAAQELITSLVDAARFIEAEPHVASELSKPFLGQSPEIIQHALTTPKGRVTFTNLSPELADFAATQDALVKYGISPSTIDLEAYVDNHLSRIAYSSTRMESR